MNLSGGCYCGAVRYEISGDIPMRALCLCATCQKISGGGGNFFVGLTDNAFKYTKGTPRSFTLDPSSGTPTREFCGECGVHIAARSPKAPGGIVVKIGTLDQPAAIGRPNMVFWTRDKQAYHLLPEGAQSFATLPGR